MSETEIYIAAGIGIFALAVFLIVLAIRMISPAKTYETQVLMKIPAYRDLKNRLDINTTHLNRLKAEKAEFDSKLQNLSKAQAKTLGEKMVIQTNLNASQANIAAKQKVILDNAKQISDLTTGLTELKGINADMATTIKTSTSSHMADVTDFIVNSFDFKDRDLVAKIKNTRNSLIAILQSGQGQLCLDTDNSRGQITKMKSELRNLVREMRQNVSEVNNLCGKTWLAKMGQKAKDELLYRQEWKCVTRQNGPSMCGNFGEKQPRFGPLQGQFADLFYRMELLIIHVIMNNLCNGAVFDIDRFEQYASKVIAGMCNSSDWKAPLSQGVDYILSKPASYAQ